jgi:hypothetical protein
LREVEVQYDSYGRMKYNPEYHAKHGTPWSYEDIQYLINWFEFAGAEEMSFALERPITAVQEMANRLRKQGVMKKPKIQTKHKRLDSGTRYIKKDKKRAAEAAN